MKITRTTSVRGTQRGVAQTTVDAQSGEMVGQAVTMGQQVGGVAVDAKNPPRNHGGGASVIGDIAFKVGG